MACLFLKRRYRKYVIMFVLTSYLVFMIANNTMYKGHATSQYEMKLLKNVTTWHESPQTSSLRSTTVNSHSDTWYGSPLVVFRKSTKVNSNTVTVLENKKSSMEAIMENRYRLQQTGCAAIEGKYNQNSPDENFRGHMQIISEHRMVYCGIEKVGSTFWRRLIELLRVDKIDTPYSIMPQDTMKHYESFVHLQIKNISQILDSNKKFLFVRNPYTRLLSGYVDKIFSPNPYFWNKIGKKAVNFNRQLKRHCGHDLTFPEFINYFIHTETNKLNRDEHFLPASDNCRPCEVKYNYIGKIKSFSEDVFFILEKFKLHNYSRALVNFKNQSIIDTIYDTAQAEVNMRRGYVRCLSIHDGLQRTWKKMQIRGLISDKIEFPFRQIDLPFVDERQLRKELLKAHIISKKNYDLNSQKQKYLVSAYNLLSLETMEQLQKIFQNDFMIFGYDQRPEYLFQPRNSSIDNDVFFKIKV